MSDTWRAGLSLAGLFAWLLSFPMFGPLLFATAPDRAPALGLAFVFAHGAGLLVTAALPRRVMATRHGLWLAGGALAGISAACLLWPAEQRVWLALLGGVAAYPVAVWSNWFIRLADPVGALMIAMAGANLVLAGVSLPVEAPPAIVLGVLTLVGAGAVLAISGSRGEQVDPTLTPFPRLSRVLKAPWLIPLAAFALADYVVGGIWYGILPALSAETWSWRPVAEPLVYVAGILLFAHRARRAPPGTLARYCLSILGLGLLVAASQLRMPAALATYRGMLLLGLAAGDLYFWLQLGLLGREYGSHRPLSLGLGLSVWLIGGALLAAGLVPAEMAGPDPLFLLCGAGLLFLLIPLAFPEVQPLPLPGKTPAEGPRAPAPVTMPLGLTPAEQQIWQMLVTGASDADMAQALFVTRHTVKFHVRNILHKTGATNRKELLSHLLTGGGSDQDRT